MYSVKLNFSVSGRIKSDAWCCNIPKKIAVTAFKITDVAKMGMPRKRKVEPHIGKSMADNRRTHISVFFTGADSVSGHSGKHRMMRTKENIFSVSFCFVIHLFYPAEARRSVGRTFILKSFFVAENIVKHKATGVFVKIKAIRKVGFMNGICLIRAKFTIDFPNFFRRKSGNKMRGKLFRR